MTTKTAEYPARAAAATPSPDVRLQRRPTTPGIEPGIDRARAVCEFSVSEYANALRTGRRYGE